METVVLAISLAFEVEEELWCEEISEYNWGNLDALLDKTKQELVDLYPSAWVSVELDDTY